MSSTASSGAQYVFIKPATEGTGIKAGGAMRAVLESVGVRNVLAKSKGSSNPHNLVKATIAALLELRDASTVADHRGVTLEKCLTVSKIDDYGKNQSNTDKKQNRPARNQKRILAALGIKKMHQTVEHDDSPR